MTKMPASMSNLRSAVLVYDTPELHDAWSEVTGIFEREGELEVPCAMSMGVRRILFQTVRSMRARSVLDIGSFVGTSAVTLALAVKPFGGRVTSVDIKDVNADDSYWREAGRRGPPRDLAERFDVSNNVDFVTMDSVVFLKSTLLSFDLICIDGWHEETAVYEEIPLALSRLNPDGLIFLDDVQLHGAPPGLDTIPGPLNAIQRHLFEGLGVELQFISKTLEGDPTAVAFLVRKLP